MLKHIFLVLTLAVLPMQVAAQSVAENFVSQLRHQGFDEIGVSRTLLGRTRIVATSSEYSREIVFNPYTGEILRDFLTRRDGGQVVQQLVAPTGVVGQDEGRNGGKSADDRSAPAAETDGGTHDGGNKGDSSAGDGGKDGNSGAADGGDGD